jgi:hypothetical protein
MRIRIGEILRDWPVLLRIVLGLLLVGLMIFTKYPAWLWRREAFVWSLPGPVPGLFLCGSAILFLIPVDIAFGRSRLSVGDLLLIFAIDLILLQDAFPSIPAKRQASSTSRSVYRAPRMTTWSSAKL